MLGYGCCIGIRTGWCLCRSRQAGTELILDECIQLPVLAVLLPLLGDMICWLSSQGRSQSKRFGESARSEEGEDGEACIGEAPGVPDRDSGHGGRIRATGPSSSHGRRRK